MGCMYSFTCQFWKILWLFLNKDLSVGIRVSNVVFLRVHLFQLPSL